MYTLPFSFPPSFIPTSQMKQNPCYLLTFLIQRKQTKVKFRIQLTRKLHAKTIKVIALSFLERGNFLLLLLLLLYLFIIFFFPLRFRYFLIRKLKSSLILMSKIYDSKTFKNDHYSYKCSWKRGNKKKLRIMSYKRGQKRERK